MAQVWRYAKTLLKLLLHRPLTGVTLIPLLADGRIVLVKRRDTGEWGLPGGLIDWGETVESSAERELKEETGLKLLTIERLIGVYSSPRRDPRMHSISISLAVTAEGTLIVGDTGEISQVKAFSPSDIPFGRLSHDHDVQLNDYLQKQTVIA
ncbi:MAG: NUDIX domain-containing protein [Synechocystis sp.]|jgi:ADP-ribose pyrophosphatase YjhB (NUDIX family)